MLSTSDSLVEYLAHINEIVCKNRSQDSKIRDLKALNAVFMPHGPMESIIDHAFKIARRIVVGHPFMDGNKATALLFIENYLQEEGYEWTADSLKKYDFIMTLAGCGEVDESSVAIYSPLDCSLTLDEIMKRRDSILKALAGGPQALSACMGCDGLGVVFESRTCSHCRGEGCSDCDNGQVWSDVVCEVCNGDGNLSPRNVLQIELYL